MSVLTRTQNVHNAVTSESVKSAKIALANVRPHSSCIKIICVVNIVNNTTHIKIKSKLAVILHHPHDM